MGEFVVCLIALLACESVPPAEHLPPYPPYPGEPTLWGKLGLAVAAGGGCGTVMSTLEQQQTACLAVTPIAERLVCDL